MDGETGADTINTKESVDYFHALPKGCVAKILSLTSPVDACRLSCVSPIFKSAGESDAVWERFLPPDYESLISFSDFSSKKEIYLRLCDCPVLIDEGKKSVSLDKQSGKKCYMIAARDLKIEWGDTPRYWKWISVPESSFPQVAELITVCWLELRGWINTRNLSPNTNYSAYLVYKPTVDVYGFEYQPVNASVGIVESCEAQNRTVYLDTESQRRQFIEYGGFDLLDPYKYAERHRILLQAERRKDDNRCQAVERKDKWLEVELGDYFNGKEAGEEGELEISILETKTGHWKDGIIVEGFEIRPKQDKDTSASKMTNELEKKGKTPAKRSGRSDMQALQEQFVAQLKSPRKGPVLEKSDRKKKKQKVGKSDQVKTPNAASKDVSGLSTGRGGATEVTPEHQTFLALVEGHDAQPISTLAYEIELPPTTTTDQEQRVQLRKTDGAGKGDEEVPLTEYMIHGADLEDHLATGTAEGGGAAQLPPFNPDMGSSFQMVPVPNRLVRPVRYMIRSATDELFRTMDLNGKGSEQHFRVAHDLLSKAFAVAAEGLRLSSEEAKAAEQIEKLNVELAKAREERDDAKIRVGQLEANLKAAEEAKKWAEGTLANKETELTSVKQAADRGIEKAKDKLKAADKEVEKLQIELDQEKN